MFCKKCGTDAGDSDYCPNCGEPMNGGVRPTGSQENLNTAVMMNQKSEALALILSLIIPRVGEMYDGKIGKGVVILLLAIVSSVLMFVLIGFILYPIVWIYSMIDSYNLAKQYNAQLLQNNGEPPW